jgi:DNA-damage-inducible protein J
MAAADALVRARIDRATKARATAVLEDMGLSVSDAIRLLMIRVADDRRLPFAIKAPKEKTKRAIAELEAGNGVKFSSVDDLMADLNADD